MPGNRAADLEIDLQLAIDPATLPAGADFETWVRSALGAVTVAREGTAAAGALGIRLVGLEEGALLNETWRQKTGATNVLAFPGPPAPGGPGKAAGNHIRPVEYGDLVICLPVVAREAVDQGKDPVHHLAHLVIHGTLHLLGYTHDDEPDAAEMEALETRILAGLGIPDPYVMR